MRTICLIAFLMFLSVLVPVLGCSLTLTPAGKDRTVPVEKPVREKPAKAQKPAEKEESVEKQEHAGAEKPAEDEKPTEDEKRVETEKPAQKTPEELEAEAVQLAKEELDAAIAEAKRLADEGMYEKALKHLDGVIEKHRDSPLDLTEARGTVQEIKAVQEEETLRKLLEEAKAWYDRTIAQCNSLVEEKKYTQALEMLGGFPAEYADTQYGAMVDKKIREIQLQQEEWQALQKMLEEAEAKYGEVITQVRDMMQKQEFQGALDLIDNYLEEYVDTGKTGELREIRSNIEEEKTRHEELQQLKAEAQTAFEENTAQVDDLVTQGKYGRAIELLEGFPAEYAQFGYGEKLTQRINEIRKKQKILEEKLKAAQAAQDKETALAQEQAHSSAFENIAVLIVGIMLGAFVIYTLRKKK